MFACSSSILCIAIELENFVSQAWKQPPWDCSSDRWTCAHSDSTGGAYKQSGAYKHHESQILSKCTDRDVNPSTYAILAPTQSVVSFGFDLKMTHTTRHSIGAVAVAHGCTASPLSQAD
jgi:hypothetical protein